MHPVRRDAPANPRPAPRGHCVTAGEWAFARSQAEPVHARGQWLQWRCAQACGEWGRARPHVAERLPQSGSGAAGCSGGVVQLVRQASGKPPQGKQLFPLLVHPGVFPHPVGHQLHQMRLQRWNPAQHLREKSCSEKDEPGRLDHPSRSAPVRHAREREDTGHVPCDGDVHPSVRGRVFRSAVHLPLQNEEHGVRWCPFAEDDVAYPKLPYFAALGEPGKLVFRKVREVRDGSQLARRGMERGAHSSVASA